MPAAKDGYTQVLDLVGKFVTKQKGTWNHEDWENLLASVEKLGYSMDDETKRNLGNVLESSKYFYLSMPKAASKKKASAKKAATKKAPARKKK